MDAFIKEQLEKAEACNDEDDVKDEIMDLSDAELKVACGHYGIKVKRSFDHHTMISRICSFIMEVKKWKAINEMMPSTIRR